MCSGGSKGGRGAMAPQKFSWSLCWPLLFSRKVQKFLIYCLLTILVNEKGVQGMNMILLDC